MTAVNLQPRKASTVTHLSSPIHTSPLIGRVRELSTIMTHYKACKEGCARVVLVVGDPGIGKTRLLDEVAMQAAEDGAIILQGGASEAEGMPPYLPFVEALGRYIQAAPLDQLQAHVAVAPAVLATLLPELITRLGELPPSTPLPAEQARFRLYEAIGMFLQAISTLHPLVLTLDDLQWADSASLDLLCHIVRHQPNARLLILGAYRESETAHHPALACTLTELSRQRMLTSVTIGPLSATETGMLAEGKLSGTLQPEVSTLLHIHSEGNPFFAEELLDAWIEEGALVQEQQQWIAVTPLDHVLPPSIVGALRQRFAHLSTESINHLRVAAIIGRAFDLWLLAAVEEQEIETVEIGLLDAIHARLIRANQTGTFTFNHDKTRECLYAEVSTFRRQRLHGRIGNLLEAHYEQEQTMNVHQLAALAFHFTHSNNQPQGIHYSLRAAKQALQTAAIEEAITYYRTTLDLLSADDPRRSDILLSLSEATLLAGGEQEAEKACTAAPDSLHQENTEEVLSPASSDTESQVPTKQDCDQLLPAHLTKREVAVLKLVAQGKSNRQIGCILGLTEKTITNYLTHIFHKTTCENRAAATAFAIRHGLA